MQEISLSQEKIPPLPEGHKEGAIELAYNEVIQLLPMVNQRIATVETKVIALFGFASIIVTLAPIFKRSPSNLSSVAGALWIAGLVAWFLAAVFSYYAFKPRGWRAGTDPHEIRKPQWMILEPKDYRWIRLHYLGKTFSTNLNGCNKKAEHLDRALVCVVVEVLVLTLALIL